jgi:hypothetical protein
MNIYAVDLKNQPGELANATINVEWLLPVSICEGENLFALCVDKIDEARATLGDQVAG